jgi:hypothetical protein
MTSTPDETDPELIEKDKWIKYDGEIAPLDKPPRPDVDSDLIEPDLRND